MIYQVNVGWSNHFRFDNEEDAVIFATSAKKHCVDNLIVEIVILNEADLEREREEV